MSYEDPGFDMVQSADAIKLLGLFPHDLDNPNRSAKLKEVLTFFGKFQDGRAHMLKVLSKPYSGDKLDMVWEYVQLRKEKMDTVRRLNPEDFDPEIAKELESETLSRDSRKRIKADILKRKKENPDESHAGVEEVLTQLESLDKAISRFI